MRKRKVTQKSREPNSAHINTERERERTYRECVRAWLGKKGGLSEVAEREGPLILENVEVVLILVSED